MGAGQNKQSCLTMLLLNGENLCWSATGTLTGSKEGSWKDRDRLLSRLVGRLSSSNWRSNWICCAGDVLLDGDMDLHHNNSDWDWPDFEQKHDNISGPTQCHIEKEQGNKPLALYLWLGMSMGSHKKKGPKFCFNLRS